MSRIRSSSPLTVGRTSGQTTSTHPRSKRNRTGRRGGHRTKPGLEAHRPNRPAHLAFSRKPLFRLADRRVRTGRQLPGGFSCPSCERPRHRRHRALSLPRGVVCDIRLGAEPIAPAVRTRSSATTPPHLPSRRSASRPDNFSIPTARLHSPWSSFPAPHRHRYRTPTLLLPLPPSRPRSRPTGRGRGREGGSGPRARLRPLRSHRGGVGLGVAAPAAGSPGTRAWAAPPRAASSLRLVLALRLRCWQVRPATGPRSTTAGYHPLTLSQASEGEPV